VDFSVQTIAAKTPRMNSENFMANSYSPPLENPMLHILFPALHSLSDEDARQATAGTYAPLTGQLGTGSAVASSTESKTRAEHLLSIDKQLFGRCLLSAALKLKRRQIYSKHCWDKAKV
jgi:hypothetical protein